MMRRFFQRAAGTGRISGARGFTLVEIMIVVGLIAIVMAFGIPSMVETLKKSPLRQATSDILEACQQARAQAILRGVTMDLVFNAKDGRVSVQISKDKGGMNEALIPAGTSDPSAGSAQHLFSANLSEDVPIEMIDVNFQNMMDADEARVRFFPNGTCDEFNIVFRSLQNEFRQVWLNVTTAVATLESDARQFHGVAK